MPQGVVVTARRPPRARSRARRRRLLRDRGRLGAVGLGHQEPEGGRRPADRRTGGDDGLHRTRGASSSPRVTKRIAERGAGQIAARAPAANRFQRFAITLDNQIISLATIDFQQNPDGIDGRTGAQIDNIGSYQETSDLAENLRIGALPINLKLISKTQVSSTLGKQALHQGLIAGAVGSHADADLPAVFYRILGLVAATRAGDLRGDPVRGVKLIPITMTLPGIAGLILTLGGGR